MNNPPELTIIVPVYNSSATICRCIDSLRRQTLENFKCIFIDDGSDDNSAEIIASFCLSDPRFRLVKKKHSGVADARNLGIFLAETEWLAWMDPDDECSVEMYEKMLTKAKEQKADILICSYRKYSEKKDEVWRLMNTSGFVSHRDAMYKLAADWPLPSQFWNKLYKRNLFENIVINSEFTVLEDYSVQHLIFHKAKKIYYIDEPLYKYVENKKSLLHTVSVAREWLVFYIRCLRDSFVLKEIPECRKTSRSQLRMSFLLLLAKTKGKDEPPLINEQLEKLASKNVGFIDYVFWKLFSNGYFRFVMAYIFVHLLPFKDVVKKLYLVNKH